MARGREIQDGEAPKAQRKGTLRVHPGPVIIGPSVDQGIRHGPDGVLQTGGILLLEMEDPDKTAHSDGTPWVED
jgi:hypothetical protein